MQPAVWKGTIRILNVYPHILEAEADTRGSVFHILTGRHRYGYFICIPNWGIGTEIASLSDRFWNMERLTTHYPDLSLVDAVSIADALLELSKHYIL